MRSSFASGAALAQSPKLGKPISEADIKPWDIAILPDGTGLPPGRGTVGARRQGLRGEMRRPATATAAKAALRPAPDPVRRRSAHQRHRHAEDYRQLLVPFARLCSTSCGARCRSTMPRTLTNDEVYALTAYILSHQQIIGENDEMDAKSLPKVKMPNRDNYIIPYPDRIQMIIWRRERCVRFGSKANVRAPNCDVR